MNLVSAASLAVIGVSTFIGIIQFIEYKNEIQRTIYQAIVGNEYEFEIPERGQTHHFTVVNVDVNFGYIPWNFRTLLVIEFDFEEFPWNYNDEKIADEAAKDLRWSFNLVSPETPKVSTVSLFDSYKAPALMVTFSTTNLFHITDFLRKTEETIGQVFWHYEETDINGISMRTHAKGMKEHLEWILQNSDSED